MAKAVFHKNQRVYVKPVGTWANVERVVPQWVKGVEEPLRVHYDVGLGREFAANELLAEQKESGAIDQGRVSEWRLLRGKNKLTEGENAHHPQPGTFPVVCTDEHDWGGWRVPSAEYDRDPHRVEFQARLIVNAPKMVNWLKQFAEYIAQFPENASPQTLEFSKSAIRILRDVYNVNDVTNTASAPDRNS